MRQKFVVAANRTQQSPFSTSNNAKERHYDNTKKNKNGDLNPALVKVGSLQPHLEAMSDDCNATTKLTSLSSQTKKTAVVAGVCPDKQLLSQLHSYDNILAVCQTYNNRSTFCLTTKT